MTLCFDINNVPLAVRNVVTEVGLFFLGVYVYTETAVSPRTELE
jgi:hypothetical protein